MLALRDLALCHSGNVVLSGVNLSLAAGEQVALIGPSGAGKTSLLQLLACATRPDAGELTAFDLSPWQLSQSERHALRRRFFLAPQTPPLPPRQRVVTAVLAGCLPQWGIGKALLSLLRPVEPERAYEALACLGLQDKLYARVDRLSGGERQRCALARLLLSQASVLLVDEPLSALDPEWSLRTLAVLQQEAARRQATLVCSLHQVELARRHFPRLIGLRAGRVVFDAATEQVTDAMIAALYCNAGQTEEIAAVASPAPIAAPIPGSIPGSIPGARC